MAKASDDAGGFQREQAAFDCARKEEAGALPVLKRELSWLEIFEL